MNRKLDKFGYDPQDNLTPFLPTVLASIITLSMTVITTILVYPASNTAFLITYAVFGCTYLGLSHWIYNTSPNKTIFGWVNASIAGIALGVLTYHLPKEHLYLIYSMVFMAILSISAISGRGPAYLLVAITAAFHIVNIIENAMSINEWVVQAGLTIAVIVAVETTQQLINISRGQLNRLQIVNKVSKQMISTLDTKELINLLDMELKNILNADTYFIGIQKNDRLHMELFYDDGEYFNGVDFDLGGSLSKWVIENEQSLFLPDLRNTVKLEGVTITLAGKTRTSLSWMGVPMKGSHVSGLMTIASYRPNAFNRSDLELLSNIAQLVTLALDNSYHHAQVKEQASLDSLTQVYNHGYFIKTLHTQAETCLTQNQQLSLIMLDIDYFKQYNDSFGHLVGDEVLATLCETIRGHIKHGDTVGRWGGEEFAISLPNTGAEQALQVAERIRASLADSKFKGNHMPFAVPTISMGIAVFPVETDSVTKLIDLADRRLYIAKERGRNQIEPATAI
jgi:diguanylate cyclase (GGDEF)-like protein